MRNLTSIESTNNIVLDAEFQLTPSDQSTTFLFGTDEVDQMPSLEWECDFAGGFGKVSQYSITLVSCLDFIKERLNSFTNAETNLKITVNSDTFYPHVGRVRSIRRDSVMPGRVKLDIYDKLLDDKKQFPPLSLIDSYDTLNPEVIDADFGQPRYYGANIRPYYHTPVNSSLSTLIPPLGVSSLNQVNSVLFIDDLQLSNVYNGNDNVLISPNKWENGTITTSRDGFEINDEGTDSIAEITGDYGYDLGTPDPSSSFVAIAQEGNFSAHNPYLSSNALSNESRMLFSKKLKTSLYRTQSIRGTFKLDDSFGTSINSVDRVLVNGYSTPNPPLPVLPAPQFGSLTNPSPTFVMSYYYDADSYTGPLGTQNIPGFFTGDGQTYSISFFVEVDNTGDIVDNVVFVNSTSFSCLIDPADYKNYSIYSLPVDTADISISENPGGIIADIFDQTSTVFDVVQNSDYQDDTDAFKFQSFFGEREDGVDIFQEFGEITNEYMWVADSGQINFRTYQDSANATVDRTLNLSDIEDFQIIENPIGTTRYRSRSANEVEVRYNYDFQKKRYLNAQNNNKNNNSFCNSSDAAGIRDKITEKTKYIVDSATASYYLDNLTRKVTQGEEFVELDLPPKFLSLELADVLKVQHPMIVGSESLYQIVQISQNYNTGKSKVTARELIL